MSGSRRLSHAIADGDGISIVVEVADAAAAREAESQGADALVARQVTTNVRDATQLPLLFVGESHGAQAARADALVLDGRHVDDVLAQAWESADKAGLECVVRVDTADDLERVLDLLDPEVLLLSATREDDDPLEKLLDLLGDVPAGKLAIAELRDATGDDVAALERAGIDGVLVSSGDVSLLVGDQPPEV